MFNKDDRRALDILEKMRVKNGNCYKVGLLWKNKETNLSIITLLCKTEAMLNGRPYYHAVTIPVTSIH